MTQQPSWVMVILRFLIALLVGVVLGRIVQTQFNLAALQSMGVEIPLGLRIVSTREDLIHFGPVYAVLFSVGFVLSQAAAMLISRWLGRGWLAPMCAGAGAIGLLITLLLVNQIAPMLTLIAATRETSGLLAMLVTAGIAGLLFGLLCRQATSSGGLRSFASMMLAVGGVGLAGYPHQAQAQSASAGDLPYYIETVAEGLEHPWSLSAQGGFDC
ncbi:hypothetical protein [Vreelandella zhaodongensis]|uniref:hypothetical protein n=1 Tax=Vreelandella zhaodongensis TaxID=1176240 RepID=UPI003EB93699